MLRLAETYIKILNRIKNIIYKDENIPAIVSEEIWDVANEIFNAKSKEYGYIRGKKNVYDNKYTYTGKLECVEHQCNFGRHGCGKRYNNPVWQCLEYHKGGLKACNTPTLFEKHLDIIFKKIISNFLTDKEDLLNIMLEDYKKILEENSEKDKLLELKEKNKRLVNLKNKLLELNLDGYISNIEFKEKNENYNKELKSNNELIKELEVSNLKENKYLKKLNKIKEILDKKIDIDNSFKDLFDLLIKKVYVRKINNDRKHVELNIIFNFDNSSKRVVYNSGKNFNFELPYIDSNWSRSKCNSYTTSNSRISSC